MSRRRIAGWTAASVFVVVLGSMSAVPTRAALLAIPVNDAYSTDFEEELEVDEPGVLANDINIGDDRADLTRDAAHGDVNLNNDGGFKYKPDDGFSGTDTFRYKLEGLISTQATVTITVRPAPTPTPSPTPTPAPTPTPTPKPTPAPTPTPTPRLTLPPVPLPTLPPLPLPTLPQILPTPTPTATPTRPPGATEPPATPSPAAQPSGEPSVSEAPAPGGTAAPSAGGIGQVVPPAESDPPGGAGTLTAPNELRLGPPAGRIELGNVDIGGMGLSVEWLVPTLVVTVPGILVIVAILAQGAGAMLWLPYVRRTLGGDRRRSPSRRATH